jgi:galactose mutarotase-like enzyme
LKLGGGFDHNWALNRNGEGLSLAARVEEGDSGRVLEVRTTKLRIQFYTGTFRDGSIRGKGAAFMAGVPVSARRSSISPTPRINRRSL